MTTAADLAVTRYTGANENCDLYDNPTPTGSGYFTNAAGLNLNGTLLGSDQYVQTDVGGFSEFYLNSTGVILPVEGLTFEGQSLVNGTLLNWNLELAEQLSHFDILRSSTGNEFSKIGELAVTSPNLRNASFEWLDRTSGWADHATQYYQLIAVDLDGQSQASEVLQVDLLGGDFGIMSVWKNGDGELMATVQADPSLPVVLTVLDLQGRTLAEQQEQVNRAASQIRLNAHLAQGVYLLKVQQAGRTHYQRFIY